MSPARKRKAPKDFFEVRGLPVTIEESHALPLVDFELLLRTGGVHDPIGSEGLTRTTWRMVRKGTRRLKGAAVEDAIAQLGARLGFEVSTSYVRIHGSVIRKNLEPFFELVATLIREPAFRAADLAQVKRESRAQLLRIRDHDRALAGRWFRRSIYEGHPYGRPLSGTSRSLRKIAARDLRAHHKRHLVAPNMLVGFSGDIDEAEATRLVATHLGGMSRKAAPKERVPIPRQKAGRRIFVIDKPARTQTQLCIGTLGIAAGDTRYFPLQVANTAFGGTFTSTLMQEVREKRGWSYGVHSRIGIDRRRDTFTMWSHPAAADAVPCMTLELDLLERFVGGGLRKKQLDFAKRYLLNSHCFEVDTAPKRLEPRLDVALFGLSAGYLDEYEERVRAVTLEQAKRALAEVISAENMTISVTATAADVLPALEKLPQIRSIEVVPYDAD